MSKTETARQLLIVAMQDLHDAERAWVDRGPDLHSAAGQALQRFLDLDLMRSTKQAGRLVELLEALEADADGDPNIWLRAILDDAERDIVSIVEGPLRDTALIGAFRKGKQAERVSYETALALAQRLELADHAASLAEFRGEEESADVELASLLARSVDEAALARS